MELEKRNLKMVIAYNGSAYHGWQRQARGITTVQEHVEYVLRRVLKHPLHVQGCSRTDSGVHAEGQVVSVVTSNWDVPLIGMRKAINARLPDDIVIRSISEVPMEFNASSDAIAKTYRYRIYNAPLRPVNLAGQVYHFYYPLNEYTMAEAASRLVGTHDFLGFASAGEQRATTVRTVYSCSLSRQGDEIYVYVKGNGFLYNMVRNIVGTLVEIGRGHWSPDRIEFILQSRDRNNAGRTAPPDGLTLMEVFYPQESVIKNG